MDEESSKVNYEEDKVLPNKNKRTFKTPSQLEALEKLYNEHNYPKDFMKSQVAEKIGLSGRQVSIWLCHRRNKHKKMMDESCENGRLDRSSGVIQDHGHDSCDSTKPGDYRDVLEPIDDVSSDSGRGLQDVFISQEVNPSDIKSSRYTMEKEAILPVNENDSKTTVSLRPSGYLKLTGNIEHAAITAVKRQLGRHYWPEGPVLGVEFEPLPPGAFEIPPRELEEEPYSDDLVIAHRPETSDACKLLIAGNAHDVYNSKIISQSSFTENEIVRTLHRRNSQDKHPHREAMQKSSFPSYVSNHSSDRNSSLNDNGDFARKASRFNTDRRMNQTRVNSASKTKFPLYGEKTTNEQSDQYSYEFDINEPTIVKRKEVSRSKPSTSLLWNESVDMVDEKSTRKISKHENYYGGILESSEYRKKSRVKMNPANDMMIC